MKFTLRDLLNAVFRYSRALIIFWAIILIAALVFQSQTQELYESGAKILVSLGLEARGKTDYINGKNLQLLQREQQIHNEQQILESHEVVLTTAKWILGDPTPEAPPPALDWRVAEAKRFLTGQEPPPTFLLRVGKTISQVVGGMFGTPEAHERQVENLAELLTDNLTVKAIFDSDTLDVTFRYRDARVAQTVLKLVIDAYVKHHITVFQSAAEAGLLKSQLDTSVNRYHDRLGEFSSFMTAHRVYNDDTQVNLLIEQREKLKQSLNESLADLDSAAARHGSLQSIQQSLQHSERYSTVEIRNKQREALLAKIDDTLAEQQALLSRHPAGSRAFQEEQAKVDELRELVKKEPEQVVQETEQRRSKASEFVESEMISTTETQRGDQARIAQLRHDLRIYDSELDSYTKSLQAFSSLKLQLTFAKQESEQMAQVYVDSRLKNLTSQNAITDISIIDAPTLDSSPASPKKKLVVISTLMLLVVGGLAVLLACIGLDTTVADGATAERRLGEPVVGILPLVRDANKLGDFSDSLNRESYREFARIYQCVRDERQEGKIILLTESGSGEGSSVVGYGLSSFLSRYSRQRTVFIDRTADSPIELTDEPAADRPNVMAWPTEQELANGDAVLALSRLKRDFSYIVISAGAVKEATDLLAISGIVSATFFIIEAGKTRRAAALYSLDLLHRFGFQGIRLILNKRTFYIPAWLMRFV